MLQVIGWTRELLALLLLSQVASTVLAATTLTKLYELADLNDPEWQLAQSEFRYAREVLPSTEAELLPKVNLKASRSAIKQIQSAVGENLRRQSYISGVTSVTLSQVVYRAPLAHAVDRAHHQVAEAEFALLQARQNMGLRVMSAYTEALILGQQRALAEDQLLLAAQKLKKVQVELSVGQGSQVDVDREHANLQKQQAELVKKQHASSIAELRLELLAGVPVGKLDKPDSASWAQVGLDIPPYPEVIEEALKSNNSLSAAREGIESQKYAFKEATSARLPTLDLTAQWGSSSGENSFFANTKTNSALVSLQLSLPLYSGGKFDSTVRKAIAGLSQANEQYDRIEHELEIAVRSEYDALLHGVAQIKSLESANFNALAVIEGTASGRERGIYSQFDVELAKLNQREIEVELAAVRYSYLSAWLRLQILCGKDVKESLGMLQRYFSIH